MDTEELLKNIRQELSRVEDKIREHPYVKAVERGSVARDRFKNFICEQRYIISSDLRGMAYLVSRFGEDPERQFFINALDGEKAALEALYLLAEALEVEPEALMDYEPAPGAQAYPSYMAWLAHYGEAAEVAGAFVVNFPVWGEVCGRISTALKEGYGLREADVGFFDLFASPLEDFGRSALEVVGKGLDRGVDPKRIRRSARLLQACELMFWDAMNEELHES